MNLLEKIQEDIKKALREKDELRLSTLRLLVSAAHNAKIEKGRELSDEEVLEVLQKQVKQRKESIEGYSQGGREDLAEKEKQELAILQEYLPEQISDSEIEKMVVSAIKETLSSTIADMGKVMGKLSQDLKGKADMGAVSSIVRKKLS
ncbi:MAG: GatB/YqeY domain-containing protein [Candidatus Woykebacteria bacterium]